MSEQTPRQKRTDQLLDKAKQAHREAREEFDFLLKLGERSASVGIEQLVASLLHITGRHQLVNTSLLQAVENMAAAPCFNGPGAS